MILHTVIAPEPSDEAIDAAVEQRMADLHGLSTQRILFAEHLAWIADQGLTSFQTQGPDVTLRFTLADWRDAMLFQMRWNCWS